jgi:hypothetical protein
VPVINEFLTPVMAVAGLGLSIYNTVQARRDKHPRLKVHVSFGFLVYGPELSDQKIFFEVGNPWTQTVTVSSLVIPLPDRRTIVFPHLEGAQPMPVALNPGGSTRFGLNSDQLEADTIRAGIGPHEKFRVMARDAIGNEYLSNAVSFKPMK